jgi:hypothetical protein
MYISNSEMFDGIGNKCNVSKMVDNRYASKQVYNAVIQKYESFFTMVISSDVLDKHFSKFDKKYQKYGLDNISLSTLGSDINSNFDKKNSINRDESRETIVSLLDRVSDNYSVMVDKGNIYSVKYADHILNISTDSSHFKYSSYAVPFIGMILHGHVNYAGSPINYSGSTQYEVLRSIENGAAPYYILCYQNVEHMKDDEQLNKYYGVNYETWYDDMLITYKELNDNLGKLQDYEIVEHSTVICERTKEASELKENYALVESEYIEALKAAIESKIADVFDELRANGDTVTRVKVTFKVDEICGKFEQVVKQNGLTYDKASFEAKLGELVEAYTEEYPGGATNRVIDIEGISKDEYTSKYNFYTDSDCRAEDYRYTEYTLDNDKVVIVKYQKGDSVCYFILNYNIYSVDVMFNGVLYNNIPKYGYEVIPG